MTQSARIASVRQALAAGRSFLIASHQNPDGDAIGSSLALAACLTSLGKEWDVVNTHGVPMNLSWLPLAETVRLFPREGASYDTVVLLDCGELSRAGLPEEVLRSGRQLINIDHHPGNDEFGTVNLVDPKACATAALVFEVLRGLAPAIGYGAATAIYTGILADTGSFRFSNSSARAFEIASQMVALGVDPAWVAQMLYDQQPIGRLRLLSRVLETLVLSPRDKAAAAVVTREMFRATHTGPEDVEGFVNHARSICGVEVGLLLREEAPRRYRVAFRSKGRVDVAAIAREFSGGGHHNAAGATIEGTLEDIRRDLLERVERALDEELLGDREAV